MKYLKKYQIFESAFNNIISKLERDQLWIENDNKREQHEYDFRYDLGNGLQLAIVKIDQKDYKLIAYLVDDNDSFNFIDYVFDGYNKLYRYDDTIERLIKIAKISSQIFTKESMYPTEEDIVNIIFPEFKEDLGFNLKEEKFGFVDINFPKKEAGTTDYKHSYEQEVYFPCDHKSKDKPKKVFIFDQSGGDVTREQLEQEFEDCKFRINELGFDLNSKLCITDTRYYNGQWRPEEFMIVLEEKNGFTRGWLESYNENLNDSDNQFLKEIELYLNDINLELVVDYQLNTFDVPIIVMWIKSKYDKKLFSLSDIKEEVEHIIFYMGDSEHKLLSVKCKFTYSGWSTIYDNKPNRWGVMQSKSTIFDIQDYSINKKEVENLQLIFSK
jgi:hypothetical protein